MKTAVMETVDGQFVLVTADGKPLGGGDVDCRMFHVLPKFLVPAVVLPFLHKEAITLKISSSLGDILPDGGIRLRQPYPNRRYFVAGSADMRHGWVIHLPEGVSEFDIQFDWDFKDAHRWLHADPFLIAEEWQVRHLIHVNLLPGERRVYTMDASCWPRTGAGTEYFRMPVSLYGHPSDRDLISNRKIVRRAGLCYEGFQDYEVGHFIEENVFIPPIAYEQASTLRDFEQEQLHEVVPDMNFTESSNSAHRENASAELPASIFLEAIRLAAEIPFDECSDFAKSVQGLPGGCESHPAMVILKSWWAANRHDFCPMAAGFAMPWVRVRDDNEYWCGDHQVPNMGLRDFAWCKAAAARVGDIVLVLFYASWAHFTYDDRGTHTFLTDGQRYTTVGVDKEDIVSGEYDEAWYGLQALADFPERFPATYAALKTL